MYSSLQKIDLVASTPAGPMYVQTDHRDKAEIEAEPELSTLFALTRVLLARAHGAKAGKGKATVMYACMDEAPEFLREVLASAGAILETHGGQDKPALATVDVVPATLADRAFRGVSARVLGRVGLTDPAAALHALEAETLIDPPDIEEDEIGYWTRVLELAAVTGEIVRAKHGGAWVECDRGEIPFGFETKGAGILLPTNRASRFIDDGEAESLFLMLANVDEARTERDNLPILPSLRTRAEVTRENMIFRPLLLNADDTDVPVIAYGTDSPTSFGMLMGSRTDDRDELHAKALANLAAQTADIEELDLGGYKFLAVTNSFFATEKLLDRAFMLKLHARLDQPLLAASVPRRGLMFVTAAAPVDPARAMGILAMITKKEFTTTRMISSAILLVSEGAVVGHAQLETSDDDPPEAPPKKPGFLRRLFGRS